MAKYNYILSTINPDTLVKVGEIKADQEQLIDSFAINSLFDSTKNTAVLKVFSLNDDLLFQESDYRDYSLVGSGAGTNPTGSSAITVDIANDVAKYGFDTGDVKVVYSFTDDVFSDSKIEGCDPDENIR